MDNGIVQIQATHKQIIEDHILGLSAYAIAEKYGLDVSIVIKTIANADASGALAAPLVEGVNPEPIKTETAKTEEPKK
jgi:hypothetical protein